MLLVSLSRLCSCSSPIEFRVYFTSSKCPFCLYSINPSLYIKLPALDKRDDLHFEDFVNNSVVVDKLLGFVIVHFKWVCPQFNETHFSCEISKCNPFKQLLLILGNDQLFTLRVHPHVSGDPHKIRLLQLVYCSYRS
jgi:hypothetical protein